MPRLAIFFLFSYVIKAPQQRLRAESKESKPASKYSYIACMHIHILHNQRASSSSLVRGWGSGNFFDHLHLKSNLRFALWVAEIFNISAPTLRACCGCKCKLHSWRTSQALWICLGSCTSVACFVCTLQHGGGAAGLLCPIVI